MKYIEASAASRVVGIILVLQLVATVAVWTLNPSDILSENLFALLTSVNLVSFAIISYAFRVGGRGGTLNRDLLLGGLGLLFLLFVVVLLI